MKTKTLSIIMIMLLILSNIFILTSIDTRADAPQWPVSWITYDPLDPTEDGPSDDYRDVKEASYYVDNEYLYFRLECYGYPNLIVNPARYKFYIDIDKPHDMYKSGGTLYEAEYLLIVEENDGDGIGDIYLIKDQNQNGLFKDETAEYIDDINVADYSINGHNIDVYIRLDYIENPVYSFFTWATDNVDGSIDSIPNIDRSNDFWERNLTRADLHITKSGSTDIVYTGDSLTYTIEVVNLGPHDAYNINITDKLPSIVIFNGSDPNPTESSLSNYRWYIPSLIVDESVNITINVAIPDTEPCIITNEANVYNGTCDPLLGNNKATIDTTITKMVNLNINIYGNGSVIKNPDNTTYVYGTLVELNAVADPGWTFSYWSGDDLSGSNNNVTINMTDDKSVNAFFNQLKYNLTVNTVGNGSVSIDPDQNNYTYGNIVNLSAFAEPGWTFSHWTGDLNSTNSSENIFIDSNKNITAYFTQDTYTLTITVIGSGSVIKNPDNTTYVYGTLVELNAVADSGWTFSYWSGDLSSSNKNEIINMTNDKSVIVHFVKSSGGGGGGSGGHYTPPTEPFIDQKPTAIISGIYTGVPYEEIEFDGTESHDNDEEGQSIIRYDWKFSDEQQWQTDLGATPTHIYTLEGFYNVTLRVFDDENSSDTNTTTVIIIKPNTPPTTPEINGPENGTTNISYNFTVVSTDEDGDELKYTINWGDGTTTESEFLLSGIIFNTAHKWIKPGTYTITVTADDNETISTEELTIVIEQPEKSEFPCWLFLLILFIILLLLLILLEKRRRDKKKQKEAKQTAEKASTKK